MLKAAAAPREILEDETLRRAQAGDLSAFAELVASHQAMVFSVAQHFLRNRSLAEELAQDVFLELHRHLGGLDSAAHLVFWLRRVTSHRCIDQHRRGARRREVPAEAAPEPSVAQVFPDPLREARLRRLVADLPAAARLVVILRYQEDLEPQEIASVLAMPINTVKSHLRRALAALRVRFIEEEGCREL